MAGPALDRELTSAAPGGSVHFLSAAREHDGAIRALLRDAPMHGAVRLSFEREPDFFAGTGVADADDETLLAFREARLVGMGRATTRRCWMDGTIQRIGYLGELRLDRSTRGIDVLRRGFAAIRDILRRQAADVAFTSIASDNVGARSLLERGFRGLPRYQFRADFATLLVPVPRRIPRGRADGFHVERGTPERLPEMVALLEEHGQKHQLAAEWTLERLRALGRHGLKPEHFTLLFARDRLVACGALWDQRPFRQTVIRGYSPALEVGRPILNGFRRALGTMELPPPGTVLAHGFVSPLATRDDRVLPELIAAIFPTAALQGLRLLTLGFDARDPRLAVIRQRFGGRVYRTRLYEVRWPDDGPGRHAIANEVYMPEVAFL